MKFLFDYISPYLAALSSGLGLRNGYPKLNTHFHPFYSDLRMSCTNEQAYYKRTRRDHHMIVSPVTNYRIKTIFVFA